MPNGQQQTVPWDDQTDRYIMDIDQVTNKKYSVSLRDLMLNPRNYLGNKKAIAALPNLQSEVDTYFNSLLKTYADEVKRINSELDAATKQFERIDELVTARSANTKVPYIKPLFINRNTTNEETIILAQYDKSVDPLIDRLVAQSKFVANVSATYKDYVLGSWLFSGEKNYIVTVNPPTSVVLTIEGSRATISAILNSIIAVLK